MKIKSNFKPLPGERAAAVFPPMIPFGERRWHRRLNLYQGRALTDVALQTEQDGRGGRLAASGQMLSPGVITGLEAGLERRVAGGQTEVWVHIAAGMALAASGEDVVAPKPIEVRLDDLPLVPTPALLARLNVANLKREDNSLGKLRGRLALPIAAVLTLQPVTAESIGAFDPEDPCEIDPRNDAFTDKQTADGCLFALYLWQEDWRPLPAPGPAWRNRIAHAIFNAELASGPDDLLPWEEAGAPIALLGFDDNVFDPWLSVFIDRYSVVRAGGRPKRRSLLVEKSGSPFLWQARIQQFAEQMAELASNNTPIDRLAAEFSFLPPFGLLPKYAGPVLRRRPNQVPANPPPSFFPAPFAIEASPIPVEELDAALLPAASLIPFDVGAASRVAGATETVRLLVPVPRNVFDPKLLVVETISQEFLNELNRLIKVRGQWLQRREAIREKARALYLSLAGSPLLFPSPDPEAIDANEPVETAPLDPAEEAFSVTGAGQTTTLSDLQAFKAKHTAASAPAFAKFEIEQFGVDKLDQPLKSGANITKGLEDFIDLLQRKVNYVEDRIDISFTRTQTDIYRIRQIVLGSDAATKLATSPTLAAIAQGQTATATRDDIEKYVARSKTQIKFDPVPPVTPRGTKVVGALNAQAAELQRLAGAAAELKDVSSAGEPSEGASARLAGAELRAGFNTAGAIARPGLLTPATAAPKSPLLTADLIGRPTLPGAVAGQIKVTPKDLSEQASIVGKPLDFRTVTISDRITQPAAPESKDFSVSNKHDTLDSLLNPADPSLAMYLDDIVIPGFHQYADNGDLVRAEITYSAFDEKAAKPVLVQRKRFVPVEEKASFKTIREKGMLGGILQGRHDLDPTDGDEGAFFSGSVRAIDHTVAILRLIEGRVKSYKTFIAACEELLGKLRKSLDQVNARLQAIGNELAEARHDVSVARALMAEEQARLDALNARRDEIVNQHVAFLAFCRVRAIAVAVSAPARPLDPGLREPAVPACLHHSVSIPPELRRMVDLLREAPVRWLVHLHPLLDRLDDVSSLAVTLQSAQLRAQVQFPFKQAAFAEPKGFHAESLNKVFVAHQQTVAAARAQTVQLNLSLQAETSWKLMRDRVFDFAAAADLIEAAHGRSDVARLSAHELDQIAHVAGCLYESFGGVPAKMRLLWAEQLSQFDAAVSLRDLASLTRWGQRWHEERDPQLAAQLDNQERIARRDMQALVDFLYQRIDPRMTEAVALVSDLARISILLASHAPVNEIISGHLPKPAVAVKGNLVEVSADLAKVKIGMEVLMFNNQNQVVARGLVEDLGEGRAAARVVHTSQPSVSLEQNARVQFTARKTLA